MARLLLRSPPGIEQVPGQCSIPCAHFAGTSTKAECPAKWGSQVGRALHEVRPSPSRAAALRQVEINLGCVLDAVKIRIEPFPCHRRGRDDDRSMEQTSRAEPLLRKAAHAVGRTGVWVKLVLRKCRSEIFGRFSVLRRAASENAVSGHEPVWLRSSTPRKPSELLLVLTAF
jgi:hypothetical protein